MEKDEDMLSEDYDRHQRIKAAELEMEVCLYLDKAIANKKKIKEDRRKSQGLLSFVLNENYIGEQNEAIKQQILGMI